MVFGCAGHPYLWGRLNRVGLFKLIFFGAASLSQICGAGFAKFTFFDRVEYIVSERDSEIMPILESFSGYLQTNCTSWWMNHSGKKCFHSFSVPWKKYIQVQSIPFLNHVQFETVAQVILFGKCPLCDLSFFARPLWGVPHMRARSNRNLIKMAQFSKLGWLMQRSQFKNSKQRGYARSVFHRMCSLQVRPDRRCNFPCCPGDWWRCRASRLSERYPKCGILNLHR